MEPDTRGVTALCDPEAPYEPVFELIFWEVSEALLFDPFLPGPDPGDLAPWELPEDFDVDEALPPDLRTMVSQLSGRQDVTGYLYDLAALEAFMAAKETHDAGPGPELQPADLGDELPRPGSGVTDQAHPGT